MTNQQTPGTPFSRRVNIGRNLDRLVAHGIQANRTGRNSQTIGVVKAGTRRITSISYIADVDVATPYGITTITVPDVRFNVPISDGDAVSLEIIGGDPRNGVFGSPIHPKGPRVITFDSPTTAGEWANDVSAPEPRRAANADFQSYVIPINVAGQSGIQTPITSSGPISVLFRLPDSLTIQTLPAIAYVEFAATLHGGLKITGGNNPGDYSIRLPSGRMFIRAFNTNVSSTTLNRIYTHNGLEAARGNGATQPNYTDKLNNPLQFTGHHILFNRIIAQNPIIVGSIFTLDFFTSIPRWDDFEYYHEITHPAHPERPAVSTNPQVPEHPAHPEYSFWLWEDLPAPAAGETFYMWLGLSDVTVDIVDFGTSGG